jgi:hypothetical protein
MLVAIVLLVTHVAAAYAGYMYGHVVATDLAIAKIKAAGLKL